MIKPRKDNTWQKIITFAVLMVGITALFNTLIIMNGGDIQQNIGYAIVLMFSPAVVGMAVTLLYERNLRGFGWRWKHTWLQLLSYITPIGYIAIAYGAVLFLGYAQLNMESVQKLGFWGFVMIPTLGITGVLLQVLGEEIGWRGFLLPQLMKKMSFTKASLIVGAAWALFHYPLILVGSYGGGETSVWFSLLCFTVAIMGANMAINWLYVKSGSLWTAVLFHATHNSILNDIHNQETPLIVNSYWVPYLLTELGVVVAVVLGVVGVLFWTQRHRLVHPRRQ